MDRISGGSFMNETIMNVKEQLAANGLVFTQKPILIGGMAMEYYGLRKSGPDIDLVISDRDYQSLSLRFPEKRKDIWGDLGVIIGPFEIWRCIMLLDYDFYIKGALEEDPVYVISMERLLLTRVFAMQVPKYRDDLDLIKNYYCRTYQSPDFIKYAEGHFAAYKAADGIIWGGQYPEESTPG
jgi:hypothetical protein